MTAGATTPARETGPASLRTRAREVAGDVAGAIALGVRVSAELTAHGVPTTARTTAVLAALGEGSAMVARVVEPQLDARIILAECPEAVALEAVGADGASSWGVFAAEAPGVRLDAVPSGDGWVLRGTKPWCSLSGALSHALVTAHTDEGRRLFAVALGEGVTVHPAAWAARGLPEVPSGPADFDAVPAVPVGPAGWYLERPGFEWGGIRVAACWYGAARDLGDRVRRAARERDGSELAWMHAGRVEQHLHTASLALAHAARTIDATDLGPDGEGLGGDAENAGRAAAVLAQLTRGVVRAAAEGVLRELAHALGPAPQTQDAHVAAQTSDLALYLLQDHAERDEARLGRLAAS